MAATMRCLVRFNIGLANNVLLRNTFLNSCRFLYTDKSLGLQGYENARLNFRNQFLNVETTFRSKMEEVCNSNSLIFTEDLKSMLHLVQKKPEDIELLIKMLTKYNSQNKEMRFGTFIFGPVVMRTFYYLDEPDLAFTAFKDPKFENFFDQVTTYQTLLSLLYKHNKYAEMRDVYDMIRNRRSDSGYPRSSVILIMAACYKENTPETFEYALKVWRDIEEKGLEVIRRASIFLAALAIKQNSSHIAIEILSTIKETRYMHVRCLKIVAYTDLKRFTDIVPIIRSSLEQDKPNGRKEYFFNDVIEKLEKAMVKENVPTDFELYKLISLLKKDNFVVPENLEDQICAEINLDRMRTMKKLDTLRSQSKFSQRQTLRSFQFNNNNNNRPILRDLL